MFWASERDRGLIQRFTGETRWLQGYYVNLFDLVEFLKIWKSIQSRVTRLSRVGSGLLLAFLLVSCQVSQAEMWSFSASREQARLPMHSTQYAEGLGSNGALLEAAIPLILDLVVLPVTLIHDMLVAW